MAFHPSFTILRYDNINHIANRLRFRRKGGADMGKITDHLKNEYEENPMKVKGWGAVLVSLACMAGVVIAGIRQDKKDLAE